MVNADSLLNAMKNSNKQSLSILKSRFHFSHSVMYGSLLRLTLWSR